MDPDNDNENEAWQNETIIGDANELTVPQRYFDPELYKIRLIGCRSYVIEFYCRQSNRLISLKAIELPKDTLRMNELSVLRDLKHLTIIYKTTGSLQPGLTALRYCESLTTICVTNVDLIKAIDIRTLTFLEHLEDLELSFCARINRNFAVREFPKFKELKRLRLHTSSKVANYADHIIEGLQALLTIDRVELLNFIVRDHFGEKLSECYSFRKLLLAPTLIGSGVTTFKLTLKALKNAPKTLKWVTWVIPVAHQGYHLTADDLNSLKGHALQVLDNLQVSFVTLPEQSIAKAQFIQ